MTDRVEEQATALVFVPDEGLDTFADMLSRSLEGKADGNWQDAAWPQLTELGAFGAVMPEERGGYGGARTVAVVARALGEKNAVTPFTMSSGAAARALADRQLSGDVSEILDAVESGAEIIALALHEQDTFPSFLNPEARLTPEKDGGFRLNGEKRMVAFASQAKWLLVPALSPEGVAIAVVSGEAVRTAMKAYELLDGTPVADLKLDGIRIEAKDVLARGGDAADLLLWMADAWSAGLCSEAVGAMRAMIDTTGAYLGVRRQFGQSLSANQALRHRFVDLEIALAKAETMAAVAAAAVDEAEAAERNRIVASARFITIRSAWKVSQEAIQMHGAIGMADETPLGRYFKRLMALSLWFGDEDQALTASFGRE